MRNCTACGKPFKGRVDALTQVTNRGGFAHFDCFYVDGVPDGYVPNTPAAITELQQIAPNLARKFFDGDWPTKETRPDWTT